MPNPEPRIMTTAEIAVRVEGNITGVRLDHPDDILVEGVDLSVSKQPTALERVQRDAETGGDLLDEWQAWSDHERLAQWDLQRQRADTAERERDQALRARDAANRAYDREMDKHIVCEAERDAIRASFDELLRTLDECGRCHQCKAHADSLAAALASTTPAEGGEG